MFKDVLQNYCNFFGGSWDEWGQARWALGVLALVGGFAAEMALSAGFGAERAVQEVTPLDRREMDSNHGF